MKLRTKTLLLTGAAMTVLFIVVGLISSTALMSGFRRLERQEARDTVRVVKNLLIAEKTDINKSILHASQSNELYAYVSGRDSHYTDDYFSNDHFLHTFYDAAVISDGSGRIIYKKLFDRNTNKEEAFPSLYISHVSQELDAAVAGYGQTGFVMLGDMPAIVSARPILKSDGTGPPNGAILAFGFLTDRHMAQLFKIVGAPLATRLYNANDLPKGFDAARTAFDHGSEFYTQPINEQTLGVYTPMSGINGRNIFILKADVSREVTNQGDLVVNYVMTMLVIAYVVLTATVLLSLRFGFLNRIERVKSMVGTIAENPDVSLRVPVVGSDELADTTISINKMLDSLEDAKKEVAEYERMAKAKMAERLEFYQRLFDGFPNPVWQTDDKGDIIYVNTAGLDFIGLSLEEVQGQSWMSIVHKSDEKHVRAQRKSSLKSKSAFEHEYRLRRFDGQFRWVLDRAQPFYDKDGAFGGFLGSILDITEKRLKVDELAYLATHDALTGVENRRVFDASLKRAIAKVRRGVQSVLLLVDLDGLKGINDAFGHLEGDRVLIGLAELIKEEMRTSDVYTRLGGDEFGIILEDVNEEEAIVTAERLRSIVEGRLKIAGGIPATISVGVTTIGIKDTNKTILTRADMVLYEAKRRGRNVVIPYKEGMATSFSDVPVFKRR